MYLRRKSAGLRGTYISVYGRFFSGAQLLFSERCSISSSFYSCNYSSFELIWMHFFPPRFLTETRETSVRNPAPESHRHERRTKSQRILFGGEEEAVWTVQGELLGSSRLLHRGTSNIRPTTSRHPDAVIVQVTQGWATCLMSMWNDNNLVYTLGVSRAALIERSGMIIESCTLEPLIILPSLKQRGGKKWIFVLVKIDRLPVLHCCGDKRVHQAPGWALFPFHKRVISRYLHLFWGGGGSFSGKCLQSRRRLALESRRLFRTVPFQHQLHSAVFRKWNVPPLSPLAVFRNKNNIMTLFFAQNWGRFFIFIFFNIHFYWNYTKPSLRPPH